MLNDDYRDMLSAFADEGVEYLIVGAYAMAAHGYPRSTMDIDLWVMPSADNAEAVLRALQRFGAPVDRITSRDLEHDDTVFQIGVAPRRIDIVTGISGVKFEDAERFAVDVDLDGIRVRIISLEDLIRNKRAAGRLKDLADLEALEELREHKFRPE